MFVWIYAHCPLHPKLPHTYPTGASAIVQWWAQEHPNLPIRYIRWLLETASMQVCRRTYPAGKLIDFGARYFGVAKGIVSSLDLAMPLQCSWLTRLNSVGKLLDISFQSTFVEKTRRRYSGIKKNYDRNQASPRCKLSPTSREGKASLTVIEWVFKCLAATQASFFLRTSKCWR